MGDKDYLVMKDIHKSFSSVSVLKDVSFSVKRGEVHGFLGGNGAGKSTLMNILGGIYSKDKGDIYIDGKAAEIQSPTQAMQNGIAFIHQELKLFSMRSVADNIFMSRLPVKGPLRFIDENKKNLEARRWLSQIELDIDPKTHVEKLSIAEQQMVEIAKALSYESQIIIFDEPTSSLTKKETQTLFRIISKLRDSGTCIIYISHKFEEIFELCDRVTVLRDGKNVGTVKVSETTTDELVRMVIGVKLEQYYPVVPPLETQNVLLKVENFVNRKLKGISFELREGEVLGIFGLVGAGRSELARAMFGLDWLMSGDMFMRGEKVRLNSPKNVMRHGISFLTEDRRGEGLVLSMHVENNLNLPILSNITMPIINYINRSQMKKNTAEAVKKFNIVAKNSRQLTKQLSGGNQQKVVFGKWRLTNPWVFILDEPTRGIDIKAKAEIYEQIVDMSKEGRSSIVISSEAPELLGICHRILVMREGELCGWFTREEATEEKLVKIAMGGG
ncbi:MAG: sugar ABC transporter ATP-binding protein [Eubacterium sp.]|jgi:ribose transport system ATP-binding protein|nr:sugar ABC transporter ATP-binding protein [Eubacterium sp.]